MKHLFISDMDGTLLGSDSLVSQESAEIITELSKKGAMITVATARTPATVEPLLSQTYTTIPAIVMTGAAMWDRVAHRYIHPVLHDPAALPGVMSCFHSHGVNPFVYIFSPDGELTVYHNGNMTGHEQKFYEERRHLTLKHFVLDDPRGLECPIGDTILVFGMGDFDVIEAIADELAKDSRLSISAYRDIFNHKLGTIEVFRAGVSKAAAVKRLAEHVGADRITVYGDNLNDLSMLAVADDSVAVANAAPEVLTAASRTIGPNTQSSVARDMKATVEKELEAQK